MAEDVILQLAGVTAGYGESTILHGVDLVARTGEVTGIIGPNGAGKSTLVKVAAGLVRTRAGSIRFAGEDVTALSTDRRIAAGLAYVAQQRSCFPGMSVAENLRLGAYLVRDPALRERRKAEVLETFPDLARRLGEPAGNLSGGQLRMLEFGRIMMVAPRLVILDEPSIGLSPALVDLVYGQVQRMRQAGMSFLIVEQNVKKLFQVADHVFVLEGGRNRHDCPPADLASGDLLAGLYLGRSGHATATGGTRG